MNAGPAAKRMMSEMISEMASNFISIGKTPEEKQNRLAAVCNAWNIACIPPKRRRRQLDQYFEEYRRSNPAISLNNVAAIRKDMETLIKRKLRMFPHDRRQIVGAQIVMVEEGHRIEVVSGNF
jgi:hypothetical protein